MIPKKSKNKKRNKNQKRQEWIKVTHNNSPQPPFNYNNNIFRPRQLKQMWIRLKWRIKRSVTRRRRKRFKKEKKTKILPIHNRFRPMEKKTKTPPRPKNFHRKRRIPKSKKSSPRKRMARKPRLPILLLRSQMESPRKRPPLRHPTRFPTSQPLRKKFLSYHQNRYLQKPKKPHLVFQCRHRPILPPLLRFKWPWRLPKFYRRL